MKTISYSFLIIAICFLDACKKDFLVQNPPTAIPVANAIVNTNDMADAVNGMYSAMTPASLFGRDIPVLGDLLADNTYISIVNSGRYLAENNYSYVSTNGEAADIYSGAYFVILQANRIIAAQISNGAANSPDENELKGEAYIVRALNYLQLVNFFGQPYTVAPSSPGVPIVTAPTNPNNPYIKPARATVSAVYAQIISDLDSAYAIMPAGGTSLHPTDSEYLCKYAAKAIESRAYLYKGDYANAEAAALLVVANGGYTLTPSSNLVAYWANPAPVSDKTETIFELAQTETENDGFDALSAIYSQDGYGDVLATPDLDNTYSATDARGQLILPGVRGGFNVFVNNKYSNLENQTDKDDIKIIRYAEVLLTLAESYTRNGDQTDAQKYLNMVAETRDPSFTGYKDSGTTLLNDIINERRKELAFEGLRFFDLTRLNVPIVRPQEQDSAPSDGLIPVGYYKRILPIPKAEIDANPNTTQNPGYLN